MNARRQRVTKIVMDVLGVVIGLIALGFFFLHSVQTRQSICHQANNSVTILDITEQRMAQNADEALDDLTSYDAFDQAKLDSVSHFIQIIRRMRAKRNSSGNGGLRGLCSRTQVNN